MPHHCLSCLWREYDIRIPYVEHMYSHFEVKAIQMYNIETKTCPLILLEGHFPPDITDALRNNCPCKECITRPICKVQCIDYHMYIGKDWRFE